MSAPEVNVPLLRKAVEWAEAEAARSPEVREWEQNYFVLDEGATDLRRRLGKSADCGTCYCIAGWVTAQLAEDPDSVEPDVFAAQALGIDGDWFCADGEHLFAPGNTIADVRRIAESLAGERL